MELEALANQALSYVADQPGEVVTASPAPGLLLLCHRQVTELHATLYEPVICLILQGRKETTLADRTLSFGAGESLLVSHDLPVVSRITEASAEAPYLALIVSLDFGVLRSLNAAMESAPLGTAGARSLHVHPSDPRLLDALSRYLTLAQSPLELEVLGPLVSRELHFRLLLSPQGAMLRRLLQRDSHAHGVARAIKRIRVDFAARIAVPELARAVGMSASAFHKRFKEITGTTPLQYQKDLRLLEARRLLTVERCSVSDTAFTVGYQSPTQFSREYVRKFGAPPSVHAL